MSNNIPEGSTGSLARVVSGIADSVSHAGNVGETAGQLAGNMVRDVVSGIDEVFKAAFGNLHKRSAASAGEAPIASFPSGADQASLSVDITALKGKIDSMRAEAYRLMQSDNKVDQMRGRNELEFAVGLFGLLSKMLDQQMQIQAQQAHGVR